MADFPTTIYDPRTVENVDGVTYEPTQTTRIFAEDVNKANDEIVAIEQYLKGIEMQILGEKAIGFDDDYMDVKPGWSIQALSTSNVIGGYIQYVPLVVSKPLKVLGFSFNLANTATGIVRSAIYTMVNGQPKDKLIEFATVSTASTGNKFGAGAITLQPGCYFIAEYITTSRNVLAIDPSSAWSFALTKAMYAPNDSPEYMIANVDAGAAYASAPLPDVAVTPTNYTDVSAVYANLRVERTV